MDSAEGGRKEFCTVVNCMDGRVQEPVGAFCRKRFRVSFVDTVTEAGPSLLLSRRQGSEEARSILRRVEVSVAGHGSRGIAVVGHHDCAGNPAPMEEQIASLREAVSLLHESFSGVEVIALWVDEEWQVREVAARSHPGTEEGSRSGASARRRFQDPLLPVFIEADEGHAGAEDARAFTGDPGLSRKTFTVYRTDVFPAFFLSTWNRRRDPCLTLLRNSTRSMPTVTNLQPG